MKTTRRAVTSRGLGRAETNAVVRFLLRLPAAVHRRLTVRAAARGLSLNELCVRMLAGGGPAAVDHAGVLEVHARAEAIVGPHLAGIVAHGSTVRGEARTTSDVDVLVVVDRALTLARALYRRWDEVPLEWDGRPVDVHFIHAPQDAERAGGVWCEAAVDGVLLYDRDGEVDRVLRRIRRAIADGRLVRKHAHGHPYWTVAA